MKLGQPFYRKKYISQVMLLVSTIIQFQSPVQQAGEAGFIAPRGHNTKIYGDSSTHQDEPSAVML
jgi:hypothetical protein